jgi:hypothetical protein
MDCDNTNHYLGQRMEESQRSTCLKLVFGGKPRRVVDQGRYTVSHSTPVTLLPGLHSLYTVEHVLSRLSHLALALTRLSS